MRRRQRRRANIGTNGQAHLDATTADAGLGAGPAAGARSKLATTLSLA